MERETRLAELEAMMASPDFWADKNKAQALVQEYQNLKEGGSGDPHDAGNATLAILAGAGGDDQAQKASDQRKQDVKPGHPSSLAHFAARFEGARSKTRILPQDMRKEI